LRCIYPLLAFVYITTKISFLTDICNFLF